MSLRTNHWTQSSASTDYHIVAAKEGEITICKSHNEKDSLACEDHFTSILNDPRNDLLSGMSCDD